MPRGMQTCAQPGCPEIVDKGRCTTHRTPDRRPSASRRGYGKAHRERFRPAVLAKHPTCTCDQPGRHGHASTCTRPSVHADHWPLSRKELVAQGLDPDDPTHGRGLCHRCHSAETARLQPGGINHPLGGNP